MTQHIENILGGRAIPDNGFGRSLTSTEIKRLRAAGQSCGRDWAVLRCNGAMHTGILYAPMTLGGLSHTGIILH